MTVDRAALRKLVEGWKPGMTVEVRVEVLRELLDLVDSLENQLVKVHLKAHNLADALTELVRLMEEAS